LLPDFSPMPKISFLLLLMGGALLPSAYAQRSKPLTPLDVVTLKKVTDPQISPDGKTIAYVVETPVRAGDHKSAHIWLVSADNNSPERPFIVGGLSDTAPRWSPDGSQIAFLSDRPKPSPEDRSPSAKPEKSESQIWLMPVHGGEALPLTDVPGGIKDLKWSKDGHSIAFVHQDQDSQSDKERKERKEDQFVVDRDYKFERLWVCQLATRQVRQLTKDGVNIDDFDWSPDGTKFVARVSPTPGVNDYWYVSKIVVINAASGEVEKTLSDHAFWTKVRWSPKGDKISYANTTAKQIAGAPTVYDLHAGTETQVARSFAGTVWAMEWNPSGASLIAETIQGTRALFAKIDIASGQTEKLDDVMADGGEFVLSRDGQTVAYLGQTFEQPTEIWTRTSNENRVRTHTNRQVDEWQLGKVQEVSWDSSKDKTRVHGLLILPWNYQAGKSYKTIVQIHGGPEWAWWAGWLASWHEWAQLLASHGYVVLLPNPRGSDGQGAAFAEANFEDWGGRDFDDIMDGVDMLVKQKIADPAQLGIGGWSYGGFMTSWAVTHTDRLKAAVIGAPVTDLFGMSTTSDIAPSFLTGYFGNFFSQKQAYDQHSPMRYIDQCHTPALILHGEADTRVPTFQGQEFYNGLRFLGRETEMVRYPREPHNFAERDHQRDLLQRVLAWYDTHLTK
jgi:dipeptidyl aminopeptidase/acylaminoacyl peptidase